MPIYRFKCANCTNVVETIQRMTERSAPDECPACGHGEFTQVISAPMFVLKGPGWANDGYHYVKTPADDIKGYSDDRRQTILPNKKSEAVEVKAAPAPEKHSES